MRFLWIIEGVEPHRIITADSEEEAYERVISIRMEDGSKREQAEVWFEHHDELIRIDDAIEV